MDLTIGQPKDRTAAGFTSSPVEPLTHQLLATLAQHRMASTGQLHVLLRPDRSRQSVSERLNDPLDKRLIDFAVLPPVPPHPGLVGAAHRIRSPRRRPPL